MLDCPVKHAAKMLMSEVQKRLLEVYEIKTDLTSSDHCGPHCQFSLSYQEHVVIACYSSAKMLKLSCFSFDEGTFFNIDVERPDILDKIVQYLKDIRYYLKETPKVHHV